jgi:predicted DNA-binding antitoxin AbrB/MazE fold protein
MNTPAKYENGVFKPLQTVRMEEGTLVEALVPAKQSQQADIFY